MCIWEWVLSALTYKSGHALEPEEKAVKARVTEVGMARLRTECLNMVTELEVSYAQAVQDEAYDDSFDWEYVPWFCKHRVDWETMQPKHGPVAPTKEAEQG